MEQPRPMQRLDDIAIFARVVQAGSFTRAAQELGLPKSTVSRRVAELEESLGALLLQRTTRRLSLTDAGRAYFGYAERIVADASEAETAVSRMQEVPRGLLRVTAPVSFAMLGGVAARFLAAQPEVQLELMCTDRNVDLIEEGFDLAIRVGPLGDSKLIARSLSTIQNQIAASPAFLKRHGTPTTPKDLADFDCVVFDAGADPTRWTLTRKSVDVTVHVRARARVNDLNIVEAAAIDGLGLALLPVDRVVDNVAAKRLRRVLADWCSQPRKVYAVYPSTRLMSPKVRAFIDHLTRELQTPPWETALPNASASEPRVTPPKKPSKARASR